MGSGIRKMWGFLKLNYQDLKLGMEVSANDIVHGALQWPKYFLQSKGKNFTP